MPYRFFAQSLVEAGSVTLVETEAHHLAHVLRLHADDVVELFNGAGLSAVCRIVGVRKRDVELEVLTSRMDPTPEKVLTLAAAVPKGDRFDWLIEKTTELGVSHFIPLVTSRSVVDPRVSKLDKLRQTVVAACKQSGRNQLMAISTVTSWSNFVHQYASAYHVLVAHPAGNRLESAFDPSSLSPTSPRPALIAIGPEGGFSDDEVEMAVGAGATAIQLGRQILRIETAAIALAARLML
jgi:16S rRNA (uracil1498-N3)-methyltransferase